MELDTTQKKIIRSKPFGLSMVKGAAGSGKTTAAIYRMLHLKNNYCLYDDDGILMVNCGSKDRAKLVNYYNEIESESNFEYISLFSNSRSNVYIQNLSELIEVYFKKHIEENNKSLRLIKAYSEKLSLIKDCIDELKGNYGKIKLLNNEYEDFFAEEISWIKSCNYTKLEEYQEAERIGRRCKRGKGPQRLLKNSKERQLIFDLFSLYTDKLNKLGLIDNEDIALMALKQVEANPPHLYTHLMIDECENLTRVEMEVLRALCHNRVYSSIMFLLNQSNSSNPFAWIIKGRKLNALGFEINGKSFALKKIYTKEDQFFDAIKDEFSATTEDKFFGTKENEFMATREDDFIYVKEEEFVMEQVSVESNVDEVKKQELVDKSFVENYKYLDLRHNRSFEFSRDGSKVTELILKQEDEEAVLVEEELMDLPVYSDIAAGEPILMSSELEANFYLPQYWLKGLKDCFILKVKGDSMIGANIEDGDLVVIRNQYNASNKDIVAVDIDGSATLKRLSLSKGTAILLPENPKYSPIPLYGTEARILGLAIGVIKNKA